jgi:hypothetical protein
VEARQQVEQTLAAEQAKYASEKAQREETEGKLSTEVEAHKKTFLERATEQQKREELQRLLDSETKQHTEAKQSLESALAAKQTIDVTLAAEQARAAAVQEQLKAVEEKHTTEVSLHKQMSLKLATESQQREEVQRQLDKEKAEHEAKKQEHSVEVVAREQAEKLISEASAAGSDDSQKKLAGALLKVEQMKRELKASGEELKKAKESAASQGEGGGVGVGGEGAAPAFGAASGGVGTLGIPVAKMEQYLKICAAVIFVLIAMILPKVHEMSKK